MAAVSLTVNVGSNDEPSEYPGLAHFLEHMLFMGSKKYPKEDDFDAFISKNGGNMNAYTDSNKTCYFFTISQEKLYEGTDIFVNFFVDPLLKHESMDKEIEAVDTEFTMAISRNGCHVDSVANIIFDQNLPHTRFNYGNRETLKDMPLKKNINMRDKLNEFFNNYYTSSAMTACILVENVPYDDVIKVVKLFEQIPAKKSIIDRNMFNWNNLILTNKLNHIYYVKAINDTNTLHIRWVVPSLDETKTSGCYDYISESIGYEGFGTIDYSLKQKNMIYSIEVGPHKSCNYLTYLSIKIKLTDLGVENINEVLKCVFCYVYMMSVNEPSYEFSKNLMLIEQYNYLFKSKDDISDLVCEYSNNMHIYPTNHYITEDLLLKSFDSNYIKQLLLHMTPENALILFLTSKSNYTMDHTTDHFRSEYAIKPIPTEWIDQWTNLDKCAYINEFIYPPTKNQFVVTDYEFIHHSIYDKYPILISDQSNYKIYYKYDHTFQQPKSVMGLCLYNGFYSKDTTTTTIHKYIPDNALFLITCKILTQYWKQKVTTLFYQAQRNGYNVNYLVSERFISFTFEGFNQNFHKFVDMCMNHILTAFPTTDQEFNNIKNICKKEWMNSIRNRQHFAIHLTDTLYQDIINWFDLSEYIDMIDQNIIKTTFNKILETNYIVALLQGTLASQDTITIISSIIDQHFGINIENKRSYNNSFTMPNTYLLPQLNVCYGHLNILNVDKNSIIHNCYQLPIVNYHEITILYILKYIMRPYVFDILRTQEKLGYSVGTYVFQHGGLYKLLIMVDFDSRKHTHQHVDNRIECCLSDIYKKIEIMTQSEFEENIAGFCTKLTKQQPNLFHEFRNNFNRILYHYDMYFNVKDIKVEYAKKITKNEILQAYDRYLLNSKTRRKLSIKILSSYSKKSNHSINGDIDQNKDSMDTLIKTNFKFNPLNFTDIIDKCPKNTTHDHTTTSNISCNLFCVDPISFHDEHCESMEFFTPTFTP